MTNEKRMSLIEAGWEFGDAEDFLELTPEERSLVERRVLDSFRARLKRNEAAYRFLAGKEHSD